MKKILISILIILLLILGYFSVAKGVNIGPLKVQSISGIKEANGKLNSDFEEANILANKTYPEEVEGLENAIRQLKISKQQYENKKLYSNEENAMTSLEVKKYKIHYLWTILGNYRKERGVQSLTLDLVATGTKDVYDLQFTLLGSYTSITDYLYDIENDEELNFEIKNFTITSQIDSEEDENKNAEENNSIINNINNQEEENTETSEDTTDTTSQETETQTNSIPSDGYTLQAKFVVENVGITLD